MRVYRHRVAGDSVAIRVPQTTEELDQFTAWAQRATVRGAIALDTETSGLDVFSDGFCLRTIQFGDASEAWVIHWERGGHFRRAAAQVLRKARRFLIHNAAFDWLVLDRHAGIALEDLAPRTRDTRVMAALVDPRQPQEGGIGTALKPLSAYYVDRTAPDAQGDLTSVFRSLGLTKANGFARIPLDHPLLNLYAGLDVIFTARLAPILSAALDRLGVRERLVDYEHEISRICAHMQRRGLILDVPFTHELNAALREDAQEYAGIAARYGVESVNSNKQITEALTGMGETLTERTAGGAVKIDKAVLLALADMDLQWKRLGVRTPNPLAEAILKSKRAGKWRSTYAETFLETVDSSGRVHPFINSMAARTGRMSVTRPALQTLPSSDQMIRRCLLADEGHVMVSTDFQAVEMRVLAALADVRRMKEGFQSGGRDFDIHMFTAQLIKGEEATEKDRKLYKGAGFGKVYGGGISTLARQTGASEDEIRRAVTAYDHAFPEIRRASARWQREARATGMVTVSATGRRMPLDRDRAYAVVNYQCQSAARDLLGQALINAESAGLLDAMRLPIHDEILASVPEREAKDYAREFERAMTFDLFGVPIVAEAEIGKRSWGSLYGATY
ncbi:DNA polymerase [Streptomyces sp. OF3]|uniref:DNA polymerase I n=1 Tax=Streptomyces alkaliterrae TaxID=2213162 RepID=A0A5P0YJB8_9ACTN|nr:DNA polymerase [Streptomyces alkaliterrae]MBB1251861.1 DNA polymerase [Streptomyces alkaliterrae]MBB1259320.1 DNA polymerase [Streptomyces alkaliterrae]MQS00301.1 DNA polymerase [Streptomyces alkaliterrae]